MPSNPTALASGNSRGGRVVEAMLVFGAGAFFLTQAADLLVSGMHLGALTQVVMTWVILGAAVLEMGVYVRLGFPSWPARLPFRPGRFALGLSFAGLVIAGLKPGITSTGLAGGAERIAVLPFEVEGQGVGYLREGMADLFAHALDGVGGVRVVDPRGVLSQWRNAAPSERDGLALAPSFMRASNTGSVLRGTLRTAETGWVLRATLWSVDGAEELATIEVEGTTEGLLALVDEGSTRLLRAIWRSRDRLPEIDVESLTTSDAEALEAYLRGETYLRRAQWGASANAFREAVRVDPSFALAHARLATALAWTTPRTAHDDPAVRTGVAAASRNPERLPARFRAPMLAWSLWDEGNLVGALQAMTEYLESYPDSRDGWQLLAEMTFHDGLWGRESRAQFLSIADRILALDPSFTPGFLHPLQVTLGGERALFFDYLGRAETSRLSDVAMFRRLGEALWDDAEQRSAAVQAAWGVQSGAVERVVSASYGVPYGSPEEFLPGLKGLVGTLPPGSDERAWRGHAGIMTSLGRLGAASDTMWARDIPRATRDRVLLLLPALAGYVDPVPGIVLEVDSLAGRWAVALVQMQLELNQGDAAVARAWADSLESAASREGLLQNRLRALAEAGRGWVLLVEGDTARAVTAMRSALEQAHLWEDDMVMGSESDEVVAAELSRALWFRLVSTMASWPATREVGIELLENVQVLGTPIGAPFDFHFAVLSHFELGHAYERAGRVNEARAEFEWFLRLLARADGGLAIRDEIAEARTALDRLAVG